MTATLWAPAPVEAYASVPDDPESRDVVDDEQYWDAEVVEGGAGLSAEMIEGLPLRLVQLYADLAKGHARVAELESGLWYADVVGLDGAWGEGGTPDEALADLREAVIGWVAVKLRVGATDIPPIDGVDVSPVASE